MFSKFRERSQFGTAPPINCLMLILVSILIRAGQGTIVHSSENFFLLPSDPIKPVTRSLYLIDSYQFFVFDLRLFLSLRPLTPDWSAGFFLCAGTGVLKFGWSIAGPALPSSPPSGSTVNMLVYSYYQPITFLTWYSSRLVGRGLPWCSYECLSNWRIDRSIFIITTFRLDC